jgi:hypothetical protein
MSDYHNSTYMINQVNQTYDLLTHLNDDNCAKDAGAKSDSKSHYDYSYLQSYFVNNYLTNLQNLTGWNNITSSNMSDICSYIYWAQIDNLELQFNPTVLDNDYCAGLGDAKEYLVSYGVDELWELGAFEFLHQLKEFGEHLTNQLPFDDMTYFQKYYSLMFQNISSMPKMVIFLAHAETLA